VVRNQTVQREVRKALHMKNPRIKKDKKEKAEK